MLQDDVVNGDSEDHAHDHGDGSGQYAGRKVFFPIDGTEHNLEVLKYAVEKLIIIHSDNVWLFHYFLAHKEFAEENTLKPYIEFLTTNEIRFTTCCVPRSEKQNTAQMALRLVDKSGFDLIVAGHETWQPLAELCEIPIALVVPRKKSQTLDSCSRRVMLCIDSSPAMRMVFNWCVQKCGFLNDDVLFLVHVFKDVIGQKPKFTPMTDAEWKEKINELNVTKAKRVIEPFSKSLSHGKIHFTEHVLYSMDVASTLIHSIDTFQPDVVVMCCQGKQQPDRSSFTLGSVVTEVIQSRKTSIFVFKSPELHVSRPRSHSAAAATTKNTQPEDNNKDPAAAAAASSSQQQQPESPRHRATTINRVKATPNTDGRKILVALDGTDVGLHAFMWALDKEYIGEDDMVWLLHMHPPGTEHDVETVISKAVAECVARNVWFKTMLFPSDMTEVQKTICSIAQEHDFNLIVTGSGGHSRARRFFKGSVSGYVAHFSLCPVMVVKSRDSVLITETNHRRKIMVCVCDNEYSLESYKWAIGKGKIIGNDDIVFLVHAIDISLHEHKRAPLQPVNVWRQELLQQLTENVKPMMSAFSSTLRARHAHFTEHILLDSDIPKALVQATEELQPDLVLMAEPSNIATAKLILGTTTGGVLREGTCPVLVYKPKSKKETPSPAAITKKSPLLSPLQSSIADDDL